MKIELDMKDLENVVIGAITTQMPRNEKGEIIDKCLHSDLINAVNEAFALYNVVGRSEQCRRDKEPIIDKDGFMVCPDCGEWGENCLCLHCP